MRCAMACFRGTSCCRGRTPASTPLWSRLWSLSIGQRARPRSIWSRSSPAFSGASDDCALRRQRPTDDGITAQLIDATTGGHLWAERYDRELTDIFAVQDDVTAKIVSALALNLSAGDRQSLAIEHVDNLEAHDCFMRGRELFLRSTREANRDAQPLLRRATELAPGFASAFAFLASAQVIDYVNGWSATPAQTCGARGQVGSGDGGERA